MPETTVFTIGHSNHSIVAFVELLRLHRIDTVADVRSAPHSRFMPDFNRELLRRSLSELQFRYLFMGYELGGRSQNAADYEDGRVRYTRVAAGTAFRSGIEQVIEVATRRRLVLLCAEKEPLDCHRTLLVGRVLDRSGVAVVHIHDDGNLETHDSAMSRLLRIHGMQELSLFDTRQQLIEAACALQEKRIAYVDAGMRVAKAMDAP